jgi:hypothetical protein
MNLTKLKKYKKLPYFSRSYKFFALHQNSFELFYNNSHLPIKQINTMLINQDILNIFTPYSLSTINNVLTFIKEMQQAEKLENLEKPTNTQTI